MKNYERSEERNREISPVEKASTWTVLQKKKEKKILALYKNQVSSVTYVFLHSLWLPVQISDANVCLKTI